MSLIFKRMRIGLEIEPRMDGSIGAYVDVPYYYSFGGGSQMLASSAEGETMQYDGDNIHEILQTVAKTCIAYMQLQMMRLSPNPPVNIVESRLKHNVNVE